VVSKKPGDGQWHDAAVRDLGLVGAAFVLGRPASVYEPPL